MPTEVRPAVPTDLPKLADLATQTFSLACPPDSPPRAIAAFVAEHLSANRFAEYLADPHRTVLVADDGELAGYAMLVQGVPDDPDVSRAVTVRPAVELSKIYVDPRWHGTGMAAALLDAALTAARLSTAASMWLGTNERNVRAQRFYRKHGFTVTGSKTFHLGPVVEHDVVMTRALDSSGVTERQ